MGTDNVGHRAGALKQTNKAHKTGRHRSKGAVDNEQKGNFLFPPSNQHCSLFWFVCRKSVGEGLVPKMQTIGTQGSTKKPSKSGTLLFWLTFIFCLLFTHAHFASQRFARTNVTKYLQENVRWAAHRLPPFSCAFFRCRPKLIHSQRCPCTNIVTRRPLFIAARPALRTSRKNKRLEKSVKKRCR